MEKLQGDFYWNKKVLWLKVKNKFILLIIIFIISIIWVWVFNSNLAHNDRNSYIVLINWNATLNSIPLKSNKKEVLKIWDTVRTLWISSLAVLEWWDGSVTRLWWNSSVKINEIYLSENLDKINISFELLSWKSWSNVVSFLWKWSYFNETFIDNVAAVRWTVFDVDLNSEYLYVIDHKVTLTKEDWNVILVKQNQPFNLKSFEFIPLEEFITNFKDKAWEKLNKWIDKELLINLEKQINENLSKLINIKDLNIDKILQDNKKRKEVYNEILADYQKLNFIKSDNLELFKKKIELKEALIKLSSDENRDILIKNTFYDFQDIVSSKKYENLDILLPILENNKDLLKSLNFNKIVNFNSLPKEIKNKFLELKILIIDTSKNIDKKIKEQLDNFNK